MNEPAADLHVHTLYSDGMLSPAEVVAEAQRIALAAIAITDHDTTDGIAPGIEAARSAGILIIPGIEINTDWVGKEIHILGYGFDIANTKLLLRLEWIKTERIQRIERIISRLHALGLSIAIERVFEIAGRGTVGRPHIGMAMVEKGYVGNISEAFTQYLAMGRAAYVPRYNITPEEAVQLILQAGGIPVLAHPGLINKDELIPELIRFGLKGIEVYYPTHTVEQIDKYLRLAQKLNLVVTGGSDFHGEANTYRDQLGAITVQLRTLQNIKFE